MIGAWLTQRGSPLPASRQGSGMEPDGVSVAATTAVLVSLHATGGKWAGIWIPPSQAFGSLYMLPTYHFVSCSRPACKALVSIPNPQNWMLPSWLMNTRVRMSFRTPAHREQKDSQFTQRGSLAFSAIASIRCEAPIRVFSGNCIRQPKRAAGLGKLKPDLDLNQDFPGRPRVLRWMIWR